MKSNLDIHTEKGQATLIHEREAIDIFLKNTVGFGIIETDKNKASDVDFIITKNNKTFAVAETKCRYDCDLEKFKKDYNSHWLVTLDKLIKMKSISDSMRVNGIGLLYIVKSKTLLVKTIIQNGNFSVNFHVRNTLTQRTVNGGSIIRANAYIDMRNATIFKENS